MSDDPNKTHVDSWFVSSQPHKYNYFKETMQKAHPGKTEAEVTADILACRKSVDPSEGRAKLTACVTKRLS